MRHTPRVCQRRAEVSTRSRKHTGRAIFLSRWLNAMSSIKGISGKPPTSKNAFRRTKIHWSPVALPLHRERIFIIKAIVRNIKSGCRPDVISATSKRPHAVCGCLSARVTSSSAFAGSRVSACRNSNVSPIAIAAPAFCCAALPRCALTTRMSKRFPTARVSSALLPSTRMTSTPFEIIGFSADKASCNRAASLKTGIMIESFTLTILRVAVARYSNAPNPTACTKAIWVAAFSLTADLAGVKHLKVEGAR